MVILRLIKLKREAVIRVTTLFLVYIWVVDGAFYFQEGGVRRPLWKRTP